MCIITISPVVSYSTLIQIDTQLKNSLCSQCAFIFTHSTFSPLFYLTFSSWLTSAPIFIEVSLKFSAYMNPAKHGENCLEEYSAPHTNILNMYSHKMLKLCDSSFIALPHVKQ